MWSIFNTWQFNLLAYLFLAVIFSQFFKLAMKNAKKDGAAVLLLQGIGGLSILLAFPFFKLNIPTDGKVYALLIIACIFYALNDRFQGTARKHLQVSAISILNQLSTVFLIIFGITIFKSGFSWEKILGAALILFANVLLLHKKSDEGFKFNKYIGMAMVANLAFAIAISIDIDISKQFNLPFYIMLTLVVPAIMIGVVEKISLVSVINEFTHQNRKYYLITGLAWGSAILFSLRSFALGEVATIVPLQSLAVLLNVLVAYVFLNEKTEKVKKIIAALLVMGGVYLTVF